MQIQRNTVWFGRVIAIALLIALGQVFTGEISRIIVMTIAGVFIFESAVDCRLIDSQRSRSFVRFIIGELALAFTWLALNIVRVHNYDAAVEGPDSTGRSTYWRAVSIQPYCVWAALVVLVAFIALFAWRTLNSRKSKGLSASNV